MLVFVLIVGSILIGNPASPSAAQGPATPNAGLPALGDAGQQTSPQEILAKAQAASEEAKRASDDANQAVNLVNSMLAFIQSAGFVVTVLVAVGGFALTAAGVRTILEYRTELSKARVELNSMSDSLRLQSEQAQGLLERAKTQNEDGMRQVRLQGERAIRALSLLQFGEQQMDNRNFKAALETFQEAYQYDPNNWATNTFLGELYVQERKLDQALEHLRRAKNDKGDYYPRAEATIGLALRFQADKEQDANAKNKILAEAEQHLIAALVRDPNMLDINGEAYYVALGSMYRRQGRTDDALRCYLGAEKVTPESAYVANTIALGYFRKGDLERATHYFQRTITLSRRALELKPNDYWSYSNIVAAHVALNDNPAALSTLETMLPFVPAVGPLETLLKNIEDFANAPRPPQDLNPVISRIEEVIGRS